MNALSLSGLKDIWRDLGGRERRIVAIGLPVLVVAIFYFMIWSPFMERLDNARKRVAASSDTLHWMQSQAVEIKAMQAGLGASVPSSLSLSGSFLSFMEESARQGGLGGVLKSVEPSGNDQVLMKFEKAPFQTLATWLIDLHTQGVEPVSVSLEREPEPGMVRARLVLGRRGQ
ncbi:MAG: type II secretion system protein M [Magnetococcales bacterium]|nr:type II secretion system protein M [Magnetococcales bacterium]